MEPEKFDPEILKVFQEAQSNREDNYKELKNKMRPEGHYWVKWTIATPWEVGYWSQHPEEYIGWHWLLCGSGSVNKRIYQINENRIPEPTE